MKKLLISGLMALSFALSAGSSAAADNTLSNTSNKTEVIPWGQIGAKAGVDYQGDGLAVTPDGKGARLHCVFQRLDGEATPEGLWLTSTVANQPSDRFRVMAEAVDQQALARQGSISLAGQTVRFTRGGLVEEYSLSMDGVRQDFIVTEKPAGTGELEVSLAVAGARVEATSYGAQLALEKSGRKIAYSQLHVTDSKGKELTARIEARPKSEMTLAIVVNDAGATYPIRIDPTFSDANWIGMGSGMNGTVWALAVSGGTLYAGGVFTTAGGNPANRVAQWNGTGWSAMGSGMNNTVFALAVSGGTLYAGGAFTTAGGNPANCVAQWNGSSWSDLGSGLNGQVNALAVSGGTLYAGGNFWSAGGNAANNVAQWDGTNWSAMGGGVYAGIAEVTAMAAAGSNVYVGGTPLSADSGGFYVEQWNGSSWAPMGARIAGAGGDPWVQALAVLGGTLYAGGYFTTLDGAASCLAKWNGSGWSQAGSGSLPVRSLAASGGMLYAGADGGYIEQWNGSTWSTLGPGVSNGIYPSYVKAIAVSGGMLYAGGDFTTAGTNVSASCVVMAVLGTPVIIGNPAYSPANGSLTLNLATINSTSSQVWMATNLTPPVAWQPIYTNLNGGLWQFTDTNTANFGAKFYRVSTP